MKKRFQVLILGKGRMGEATAFYLKRNRAISKIAFFSPKEKIEDFDLLIGALPGKEEEKSLKLALKYKKDLIDLADLEAEFYLKKKREAEKKNILVVPNCGFCPGLVNLILGQEIEKQKEIKKIEIKVGTFSPKKFFFPFLWCFEDLILEHKIPSWQKISGRKVKLPSFSGKREEKFFGTLAESYFAPSGLEHLINSLKVKDFHFRVIRPFGFFYFFQFLKNQGFLEKENFQLTKKILEKKKENNFTLGEIKISNKKKRILWQIRSFSKKREKLNSMQKIAALFAAIISNFIFQGKIKRKGVLLPEEIGKDKNLFQETLKELKKGGISIKRFFTLV